MDGYKHYIKTKIVGTDTLVVDGYADWQTDKYNVADTQLSGTFERHFNIPLFTDRGQIKYKLVSNAMTARTQAELDTEYNAQPPAPPSSESRLAAAEAAVLSLMGL